MSELDCEVKPCVSLDSFFSSFSFSFSFTASNFEVKFDPETLALKLVSGFLFSTPIPSSTGAELLSTDLLLVLVLASKVVSAEVVGVAEREWNKLSPQLPISANASWPRLNLGGANEYLFFFFEGTAGDIDNEDMLNSSGGNETGPSSSSSASPAPRLLASVTPEVFR